MGDFVPLEQTLMNRSCRKKLVREGEYVAEVEVRPIDDPPGWGPYLSVEDARKLDQIRSALKAGDVAAASSLGRVYRLVPVSAA